MADDHISGEEENQSNIEISKDQKEKWEKMEGNYSQMQSQRDSYESTLKKTGEELKSRGLGKIELDGGKVFLSLNEQKATEQPVVEKTFDQKKEELDNLYDNDDIDDKEWNKRSMALQEEKFQNTLNSSLDQRDRTNSERQKQTQYISEFTRSIDSEFPGHNDPNSPFFKEMQKEIAENSELKSVVNQTLDDGSINPNFNAASRRLLMGKAASTLESKGEWKRNMQDNINRSMNTGGQSPYVETDMSNQAGLDKAKILISNTMGSGAVERLSKMGMDTVINQIQSREIYSKDSEISIHI
jgi:hypothetical protein